jgi:hypothetical protein
MRHTRLLAPVLRLGSPAAPVAATVLLATAVLLALSGCATAGAGTAPDRASHLLLFGEVAHPTPIAEADPEIVSLWRDVETFLAIRSAELAGGGALETGDFLRSFVGDAHALIGRLEALAATGGAHEQHLARIGTGAVLEHLAREIVALPAPAPVAHDAALEAVFRDALLDQAGPVAARAQAAYGACAEDAGAGRWAETCRSRAEDLAPLADRRATTLAPPPPPARPATAAGPIPDGCGESTRFFPAPQAPPPDLSRPAVVAVVAGSLPLAGPDQDALLTRITERANAHTQLPVLSREEVRRAEALVAARKWREDGPVCGQAPPLPAVLAEDHPHLVLAQVRQMTMSVPAAPAGDIGRKGLVHLLSVDFSRAGHGGPPPEDVPALPGNLVAPVDDASDPVSWLAAADGLEADRTSAIFGMLGSGAGPYLHVAEPAGSDPWLGVGGTLAGTLADRVRACYAGPGVVGFDLSWRPAPDGTPTEIAVAHVAGPEGTAAGADVAAAVEAARQCLAEVIAEAGWPCPRRGTSAEAQARVCVGHPAR